jgi:uncharacterized protein with HEPN domain
MSSREYLLHIMDEIHFVRDNSKDLTFEAFLESEVLKRAFLRSLAVIGEAVKKLPDGFRASHPEVPWRVIAGTRDKLIHDYFGVDYVLVWDIVQNELPSLEKRIDTILQEKQE